MGFNMSWVFVDQIELHQLYAAFDVVKGVPADPSDLGTSSRLPLAGFKSTAGWCAVVGTYSTVLDLTIGTEPPRLARLPSTSRAISCVILEHANISYASCWQGGRHIWEIRHQPTPEWREHLEFWGDMPKAFTRIWEAALQQQKEDNLQRNQRGFGVDYISDVPIDVAAEITGFRHDIDTHDSLRDVTSLKTLPGVSLDRLSNPPKWWQTVGSIDYR